MPVGVPQREHGALTQQALGDARHASEDGLAQDARDLVLTAQARVELLEQEGEADAGEQADAHQHQEDPAADPARLAVTRARPARRFCQVLGIAHVLLPCV